MKEWFVVVSHPKMWLLFPLFFTSWFYGSYIGANLFPLYFLLL